MPSAVFATSTMLRARSAEDGLEHFPVAFLETT